MGGKSKKLIYVPKLRRGLLVRKPLAGRPLERISHLPNPRQILAHNDGKRKKIMFINGLRELE